MQSRSRSIYVYHLFTFQYCSVLYMHPLQLEESALSIHIARDHDTNRLIAVVF
jgi:hypothetical protein